MEIKTRIPTLKAKLKKKLLDSCEHTTAHGLPRIVRARSRLIQIIWVMSLVASIAYCSYTVYRSTVDYLDYKTIISQEYARQSVLTFPAVTFCNLNPFNEQKAEEYFKRVKNAAESSVKYERPSDVYRARIDTITRIMGNQKLTIDNHLRLGFTLYPDMLLSCKFNKQDCDHRNFTSFWSNSYGLCYTFAGVHKISDVGPKNGLHLELSVKPPYVKTNYWKRSGIHLLVYNQSTLPVLFNRCLYIPTGFETYVGISCTFINKLPHPYSNCITSLSPFSEYSSRLFDYFHVFNITSYNEEFCYNLCYQDQLIDTCQCIDIITPRLRNMHYCVNKTEMECMNGFYRIYSETDKDAFCKSACRPHCNDVIYQTHTFASTFPTIEYAQFLSDDSESTIQFPRDPSDLALFAQQSLLKLIVNYDSMTHTVVSEQPSMTFESLLGSIGGQLGLFVGISVLSFVELIELVAKLLFLYRQHIQRRNKSLVILNELTEEN